MAGSRRAQQHRQLHALAGGGTQSEAANQSFAADDAAKHRECTLWRRGRVAAFLHYQPRFNLRGNAREHFRAGRDLITIEIGGVRCTPLVCYDLRFADEFWSTARDTDAYLVVANWPSKRRLPWQVLLQARAIENQADVVGVNRGGSGGGSDYPGDSRIVDPQGEVLAAAALGETTLIADLSPERVADTREHFRFLRDRRTG